MCEWPLNQSPDLVIFVFWEFSWLFSYYEMYRQTTINISKCTIIKKLTGKFEMDKAGKNRTNKSKFPFNFKGTISRQDNEIQLEGTFVRFGGDHTFNGEILKGKGIVLYEDGNKEYEGEL